MITFTLLAFFFLLAILFGAVAYTSNSRPRAGMKGIDPSLQSGHQQAKPGQIQR